MGFSPPVRRPPPSYTSISNPPHSQTTREALRGYINLVVYYTNYTVLIVKFAHVHFNPL